MNEALFRTDQPPFTLASGRLATANAQSYDLAGAADRDRMIEDNLVNFADEVRADVRAVDPTALVSVSSFAPNAPNRTRPAADPRVPQPLALLRRSSLDFYDVHAYPVIDGLTWSQFAQNYQLGAPLAKPVFLGEFGAARAPFATAALGAAALAEWQAASCRTGVSGWSLFTWDTREADRADFPHWVAVDADSAIANALAPRRRPDPCAAP